VGGADGIMSLDKAIEKNVPEKGKRDIIWKIVDNFPNYSISNNGRLKTIKLQKN
jgi:hypothetical protein